MKLVKRLGATALLILGLSQVLPIYAISSGLLLGQGGESRPYFFGKLTAHILIASLLVLLAMRLFKNARNANGHDA